MYDPAHARSRTLQPIGGNFKLDLTLKICLVTRSNNFQEKDLQDLHFLTEKGSNLLHISGM